MGNGSNRGKGNFYFKVGEVSASAILTLTKGDVSISTSRDEIETTTDSEDGYKCFISGDSDVTISGSFNYADEASSAVAQEAILDSSLDGDSLFLEWAYETGATKKKWSAKGFVTSFSHANGDPQVQSFTIRVEGLVTEGVQV